MQNLLVEDDISVPSKMTSEEKKQKESPGEKEKVSEGSRCRDRVLLVPSGLTLLTAALEPLVCRASGEYLARLFSLDSERWR